MKTTRIAMMLGLGLCAFGLTPGAAQAASSPTILYASPSGSGTACSSPAPCSLAGAQSAVEAADANMSANIDVDLYGGTYRLSAPLQLGPADSGSNGYDVVWQAMPGQVPVFSGADQVTGFSEYNSSLDIWRAPVAAAEAAAGGQQLFVNGQRAQLARSSGTPAGLAVTSTGFSTTDSSYASFANQSQIQVVDESDWKHESCPVSSITSISGGGSDINVLPSCWSANNTDVPNLGFPFNGSGLPTMSTITYAENAYALLTQPGQFYSSGPCQQTSTLSGNVVADGNDTNNMLYQDEGSSCWDTYDNVSEFSTGNWIGMWTPTINTIDIHDNYSDDTGYDDNGTHITFNQAAIATGGAWPSAAQTIIAAAGVPAQYAPVTGRIDDDSLAITYTGSWAQSGFRGDGDFDNGVHYTETDGGSASLTFTGTGVQVLGETNSDQGEDEIYLDGVDKGAVDTDTSSREAQQVIYSVSGLTPGSHTIEIVKDSGTYTTLDGFEVTTTINDTDPAIDYQGSSWFYSGNRGDGDYGNDVHATTNDGDSATVSFYGTGITYYAETNSDEGDVLVSLDGSSEGTVDAYSATRDAQQALYSVSGLTLGLHTLTLTKQSGTYLLVDRFDVQ